LQEHDTTAIHDESGMNLEEGEVTNYQNLDLPALTFGSESSPVMNVVEKDTTNETIDSESLKKRKRSGEKMNDSKKEDEKEMSKKIKETIEVPKKRKRSEETRRKRNEKEEEKGKDKEEGKSKTLKANKEKVEVEKEDIQPAVEEMKEATEMEGSEPPHKRMLIVTNLSAQTDNEILERLFKRIFDVVAAKVVCNGFELMPKGYVCFKTRKDALKALESMQVVNCSIDVNLLSMERRGERHSRLENII
ncbi:hypothetical protein PMAYCL1PPCAC_20700, partial [Pristionchus mayeri]